MDSLVTTKFPHKNKIVNNENVKFETLLLGTSSDTVFRTYPKLSLRKPRKLKRFINIIDYKYIMNRNKLKILIPNTIALAMGITSIILLTLKESQEIISTFLSIAVLCLAYVGISNVNK